jgi:hypothetical protein
VVGFKPTILDQDDAVILGIGEGVVGEELRKKKLQIPISKEL